MGSPQFSAAVRAVGDFQTNSKTVVPEGDSMDVGGTGYPYTFDPAATIEELIIHVVGAEIDATITTSSGDVFTIPVDGPATFNRWQIDSVEFSDPSGTQARLAASWAGDS